MFCTTYKKSTLREAARRTMFRILKHEQGETFDDDSVDYADYKADELINLLYENEVDADIFDLCKAIVLFHFSDNQAQLEAIIDFCAVQKNRFFNQK